MKQVHVIDGVKRVVEKIIGRRKLKSSYEYEVQWVGCHPDQNTYIPRDELVQMGFEKMVNECDAKEAAAQVRVRSCRVGTQCGHRPRDPGGEMYSGVAMPDPLPRTPHCPHRVCTQSP